MRSSNKDETLALGKVVGLHGVKGEVKAVLYGDAADEGLWKAAFVEWRDGAGGGGGGGGGTETGRRYVKRARRQKGHYIVEIEGFTTRASSGSIVGKEVLILKEDLPEPKEDEYYYFDLIGMEVSTEEGRSLGKVTNITETGSNDVLEVRGPLGEILIPAIESVLKGVDRERKRITVSLLEGLLPEGSKPGKGGSRSRRKEGRVAGGGEGGEGGEAGSPFNQTSHGRADGSKK